ncbi:hypothetical protein LSAT2_000908 [Lamellibrachia satsuma]|nr:hypothetical protein LSAT2_000908 [Lamellibrachia satsuma]
MLVVRDSTCFPVVLVERDSTCVPVVLVERDSTCVPVVLVERDSTCFPVVLVERDMVRDSTCVPVVLVERDSTCVPVVLVERDSTCVPVVLVVRDSTCVPVVLVERDTRPTSPAVSRSVECLSISVDQCAREEAAFGESPSLTPYNTSTSAVNKIYPAASIDGSHHYLDDRHLSVRLTQHEVDECQTRTVCARNGVDALPRPVCLDDLQCERHMCPSANKGRSDHWPEQPVISYS